MEPPSKSQAASKKKSTKDPDKGMEGRADDDQPIPCKRDAHRKEREPSRRPNVKRMLEAAPLALLARWLSQLGTLVPRATESTRHILPLHIESPSEGCFFPWA